MNVWPCTNPDDGQPHAITGCNILSLILILAEALVLQIVAFVDLILLDLR